MSCGKKRLLKFFRKLSNKYKTKKGVYIWVGYNSSCFNCESKYQISNQHKYKGRYKKQKAKYDKKRDRTPIIENARKYRKKFKPLLQRKNRHYHKKQISNLTDNYISKVLAAKSNFSIIQIKKYPLLIEAKRQQLKLKRLSLK